MSCPSLPILSLHSLLRTLLPYHLSVQSHCFSSPLLSLSVTPQTPKVLLHTSSHLSYMREEGGLVWTLWINGVELVE